MSTTLTRTLCAALTLALPAVACAESPQFVITFLDGSKKLLKEASLRYECAEAASPPPKQFLLPPGVKPFTLVWVYTPRSTTSPVLVLRSRTTAIEKPSAKAASEKQLTEIQLDEIKRIQWKFERRPAQQTCRWHTEFQRQDGKVLKTKVLHHPFPAPTGKTSIYLREVMLVGKDAEDQAVSVRLDVASDRRRTETAESALKERADTTLWKVERIPDDDAPDLTPDKSFFAGQVAGKD